MGYKWKPNASQRREFAERMKDPEEQAAYTERKRFKNSYEGFKDKNFVPTKDQNDFAFKALFEKELTPEQKEACNQVVSYYGMNEKCHHDYIHVVNKMRRSGL